MIRLRALGTVALTDVRARRLDALLTRPKLLALLTYMTLARPRGFQRRDTLLGLLWPELDQRRARGALRQALYELRRALGDGVVVRRGRGEVGVDPGRLRCDAAAFESSLRQGRLRRALILYRGELLKGLHVPEAMEFERWLERERAHLRERASSAAQQLAEERERAGDVRCAAHWWRRAVELSPDEEGAMRSLLLFLGRVGERAGALRAYESFAEGMRKELGVDPSLETRAVMRRVREETPAEPGAN